LLQLLHEEVLGEEKTAREEGEREEGAGPIIRKWSAYLTNAITVTRLKARIIVFMFCMMVVCFYPLHVLTGNLNIGGEPRKYVLINDDEQ
jgi:hypothetical protein